MSYETLSLEIENRVATITINRPKMMNAFNEQLIWDMGDATQQVKNDSHVRVLVITGEGRGFSAGADLTEREASWSATWRASRATFAEPLRGAFFQQAGKLDKRS